MIHETCGSILPNGSAYCTECKHTEYSVLIDERDTEWDFDDEAFVTFLDEGE